MRSPALLFAVTSFLSASFGAAAVLVLSSSQEQVDSPSPVPRVERVEGQSAGPTGRADEGLRMTVARLEEEVRGLRAQLGQLASARSAIGPAAASVEGSEELTGASAAREEAVFEEVTRALAKIDEQKAAAARVEELKKRGEEQSKAFEEYEQVQANLSERIAKLAESMPMSNADQRDLQRLSDLQVERMRDLTRSWAAAELTDEEVAERFMAERREHRRSALALLGEERIGAYQQFIQAGGFGGRYAFYTAPREDWRESGSER